MFTPFRSTNFVAAGWLQNQVAHYTGGGATAVMGVNMVLVLLGLALAYGANRLTLRLVRTPVLRVMAAHRSAWGAALQSSRLLSYGAHLVSLIVLQLFFAALFPVGVAGHDLSRVILQLYLLVAITGVILAVLDLVDLVAEQAHWGSSFPVTGFTQALKLVTVLIALILAVAALLGKSPAYLLSGLGALTAILMLVFKDVILGFTAGIVLSANRMVSVGDWIEMPSMDADGAVIAVTLTTIKVRNWDQTVTSIPAYALVSQSFRNWQGMFAAGGRRIKRAISLDMQTIRFATAGQLEHWQKIALLRPYLESKLTDIEKANQLLAGDLTVLANGRRLTNIGTFRAYCQAYLRKHPGIHQGLTLMVRQLAPTETGVPIELYAFTSDTAWVAYEGIQADIFDHLFAVLPEFGLAVYQRESDAASRRR